MKTKGIAKRQHSQRVLGPGAGVSLHQRFYVYFYFHLFVREVICSTACIFMAIFLRFVAVYTVHTRTSLPSSLFNFIHLAI